MTYFLIFALCVSLWGCSIPLVKITETEDNTYNFNNFNKSDTLLLKAILLNLDDPKSFPLYSGYLKQYNAITKLRNRSIDGYFNYMYLEKDSPLYYQSGGNFWINSRDKVKTTYEGLNEK